nr:hypothetical protein [Tanacetum cinerariifolium]
MKRVRKGFAGRDTPLFPTMLVKSQEELEYEAFNKENVSEHSNDPLHSGEDRIPLKELTKLCTKLESRGWKERKSRSHGSKRLYKVGLSARVESYADEESLDEEDSSKQGSISDIDANQDIYLVNVHRDEDIFGVNDQDDTLMFDADKDLQGEEVVVEEVNAASIATTTTAASIATTTTVATTLTISMDEISLAKALIEIKTSRPKVKGLVMQEPNETPTLTPIVSSQQPSKVQDKDKGIMVEEPLKMKKKDQILFDEEVARKLQEEIYEQERLIGERARQEEEANNALIKTWEDIQAKVDADYQLAERLHAEEQEQLTDVEKAKLFMKFLKKRRKLFTAKRDKERRKKQPIKAQQRKLFDKTMERINSFVDFRTELVEESAKKDKVVTVQESSSKRAKDELEQEIAKKRG